MWNGRSPQAGLVVCFKSPVVLVVSDCGGRRQPLGCVVSRKARLQGAALELSLPVVHVDGLAVSRREAAGGGALSGVVNCFTAHLLVPSLSRYRLLWAMGYGGLNVKKAA